MNIFFTTASLHDVEVELHFTDGKKYGFEARCQPHKQNFHVVVGRLHGEIEKMLVRIDDYWYTERIEPYAGDITIKIDGREKYTQMLRDAAMKVKPNGNE